MHFQRLRLSGFKSFVEATEFRIEPGLTGLVGPNGCGKSNLLEAMRWVMGANSARSLRADGMDEVIFGGSNARAARSHAEVKLEIDNADHQAPAPFNADAVIEVTRRIDRGRGSSYRVNGVEVRAKDVQLLFADASSGANSPSLVRQGQISELIAAKPANRRRILEEAAGVAGLHGRRHEADLRLSSAQANLERLDDVIRELDGVTARLRRDARQAESYRRLAADIRLAESAVLLARWREKARAATQADLDAQASRLETATAEDEEARTATLAAGAAAAAPARRQEEMIASALLQRLALERDRFEHEHAATLADLERLERDAQRLRADRAREAELAEEAARAAEAAGRSLAELDAALITPSHIPTLETALGAAEARRAADDREVERVAAAVAAAQARQEARRRSVEDVAERRRLAARRLAVSTARLERTLAAAAAARCETEALSAAAGRDLGDLRERGAQAEASLEAARRGREAAERSAEAAVAAESSARSVARRADDDVERLRAEAAGLMALVASDGALSAAIEGVTARPGYEAALAAAFGDDLDAGLDVAAATYWSGRAPPPAPTWSGAIRPLAEVATTPPELAARLAYVGLTSPGAGAALALTLPVGARLVSREGDLWRWDGFVSRADAPRPAARRLEQRARLVELQTEIEARGPALTAVAEALAKASEHSRRAQVAVGAARADVLAAEAGLAPARAALEAAARDAARADAGRLAGAQAQERLAHEADAARRDCEADRDDEVRAAAALIEAQSQSGREPDDDGETLQAARIVAARARAAENDARAALDAERRRRDSHARRRQAASHDAFEWTRRASTAAARCATLDAEALRSRAAEARARAVASTREARRQDLLDRFAGAQERRDDAAKRLTDAETGAAQADRAARDAAAVAGIARERRAAAEARLEPARADALAAADAVRRVAEIEPEALETRIAAAAVALPGDPQALEAHLVELTRRREALGPVNLRAIEELDASTSRGDALARERADLTGAIARLRAGVAMLNAEGRDRLIAAFAQIDASFRDLFATLFDGGRAELRLIESDDPLEAGLEIYACPPGKKLSTMSLMSGGEQALTACALIFAVFLANPSPACVLDEVDAPLDDANVDRFCRLLDEMRRRTTTRFIVITHNPVTMSRMDRLMGVTMAERGVSQLVSVDLTRAEALSA